jgi:2-C-methyl-D-erythritol 4-phosphate cytidylyltransferase
MNGQHKYVIIVAGGKGLRMGGDTPKQFMLLDGCPVLIHTIQAFYDFDSTIRIILVLPHEQREYWENLSAGYHFSIPHQIVSGGETRFHSVKNGLAAIGTSDALIGVHDGVRPLIDKGLIARVYEKAATEKAAYPGVPIVDSMRKITDNQTVPVDRSQYFLVQTPQVFKFHVLVEAYKQEYKTEFTDDVSVIESSGICRPVMVEGSRENIKITTPADLIIAQALMKCRI